MKIVYCVNSTFNSGGMERILKSKVNYLVEHGYDVLVVTTEQRGRKPFFSFSSSVRFVDLDIQYDADKDRIFPIRFFNYLRKRYIHRHRLLDLLLKEKPDITISMFDRDFSFLYSLNDGSKKILEFHFCRMMKIIESRNFFFKMLQRLRLLFWDYYVRQYDCFVVLSEEDKRAWGNVRKMQVIPNCIDTISNANVDYKQKRVCSLGRLSYQKGFDLLIEAWGIVISKFPDWRLVIRGGGNSYPLLNLIQQLNLESSIEILPPISDVEKEYLNSSLYVMSSRYEGFGLVLIEAMACGLPVVSFACPCGPSDIVKSSFGTLVETGNVALLAQAIMEWLASSERRAIGGLAAKEAASSYLEIKVMQRWENLFHTLLYRS